MNRPWVRELIETLVDTDLTEVLVAVPYQPNHTRREYRHGPPTHALATGLGPTALLVFLAAASCSPRPWQVQHFDDAVDHATQEIVVGQLGSPDLVTQGADGGVTWVYRYSRGQDTSALFQCRNYLLTFDAQKILRRWTRTDCSRAATEYDPENEKLKLHDLGQSP